MKYKKTHWSLSKYGGELLRSGKKSASCTVEDIAGGSLRATFTSSAITVNNTGSPVCVRAVMSSIGFTNLISPEINPILNNIKQKRIKTFLC